MKQKRETLLRSAFFTSLALVLRKGNIARRVITGAKTAEEILRNEDVKEAVKRGVREALISAHVSKASGPESFIMGLAGGIAGATRIWNPSIEEVGKGFSKQKSLGEYIGDEALWSKLRLKRALEYFDKVLYPVAIYLSLEALLEDYMVEVVKLDERMKRDILTVDNYTKAYLLMWTATRYTGERELAYDFVEKVCKTLNVERANLVHFGLMQSEKSSKYRLLFGSEVYEAVKGRLERLTKTVAGQAIHVLRLIGEQPKDDVAKVVKAVFSAIPVGRNTAVTALFLLRTATDDELKLVNLSMISKDFAESVLMKLYQGV
jgi:hypothetical protein